MITKETFFSFLKDNKFCGPWMEAYKIDDEIHDDHVPLNKFFEDQEFDKEHWFYSGIMSLAFAPEDYSVLYESSPAWKKHEEWREKHLNKMMELDEKWMNYVAKM